MGATRLASENFSAASSPRRNRERRGIRSLQNNSSIFSRRETRRPHSCLRLVLESVRIFTFHRIAIHSEYNCANCLHSTLFVIKTLIIRGLWSVDTIYTYLHLSTLVCTCLHFICTRLHASTFICTSACLHLLFDVFVGIDMLTNGFSQWRCTLMRGRHFCCSERKSSPPVPGHAAGVTV